MSKTTRIATCPFADTYENLFEDNPVLRNGQRVYVTDKKQWYTGDGIKHFNELTPDVSGSGSENIDLSGYTQTILDYIDYEGNIGIEFSDINPYKFEQYPVGTIIRLPKTIFPDLYIIEQGVSSEMHTDDEEILNLINNNGYIVLGTTKYAPVKAFDEKDDPIEDNSMILSMYNTLDVEIRPEEWFIFESQTKTIMGFNEAYRTEIESTTELIIPYCINGIFVESIGDGDTGLQRYGLSTLMNVNNIKKVYLPNCIININNYCFDGWSFININLPSACIRIGTGSFQDTSSLEEITTQIKPNSEFVIETGAFTFSGITCLDNLIEGMTIIHDGFESSQVKYITIPENVKKIESGSLQTQYTQIEVLTILNKTCILESPFEVAEYNVTNNEENLDFLFPKLIRGYSGSTAEEYANTWNIPFSAIDGGSSADLSGYQTIENMMTSNDFLDPIAEKTDDKYVSAKAVYEGINEVNSRIDNLDNQSDIEDLKNNTTFGQNAYSEGENSTEGIAIGYNAMTGVNGVAIGPDACNKGTLENGMPYYTSAIQLGRGTNPNDGTFQVYNYQLLDAEGKIPAERLPEGIGSSSTSTELSNFIINATGSVNNITCDVTFWEIAEAAESGKTPILKIDSPEAHSGTIIAYCEGIYNTESGGYRANFRYDFGLHSSYEIICDGPQNRWYSQVSRPVVGETEYINLQMADAANSTKIDQNTTAINDISKNMISKNSNSLLIGNGATIVSGTTNNVVIGQAANVYSGDNNIVMGQYSSADGDRNVAIGYSSSTFGKEGVAIGYGATTSGGVAIGGSARAFKSDPINAIQLGNGTNPNEGTFQVYDYQLLDAEGKIPEERISNMFYLDGDNLKISIGGKTFTLTPDAE